RIRELRRRGIPTVVVVSARAGVTNRLRSVYDPRRAPSSPSAMVAELRRAHPGLPASSNELLRRAGRLVARANRSHQVSPALKDDLLGMGERLSVQWFAFHLNAAGIRAVAVEADVLGLRTDGTHGAARIQLDASESAVRRGLGRHLRRGVVPVVTGFIGRSPAGRPTTLGRGGSDYSASAIGALLDAARVELVKRNVAIATGDPSVVPAARPISHLSYEEAEEIAQFGAQVLHPVAIEPARDRQVPIYVRSLNHRPLLTVIGPAGPKGGARAVTLLAPLRLVSLRVAGGRQKPGLIAEITRRLAEAHINVASVVTTEAVLGLLVEPADARRTRAALSDVAREHGAVVGRAVPVALVSAVGEGILEEIARIPRRYLPRAEGLLATARSISFLIHESAAIPALRELHRTFVEQRPAGPRR
ncbi:MAG TPA: aspartate kinase, partial [Thermoplasmata archaeon]